MTRIILDPHVAKQLHSLVGITELCDPSGKLLGRFEPVIDMAEWEPVTPEASEEELQRREKSEESYTTAEVLAMLENLKCSESGGNSPPSTN